MTLPPPHWATRAGHPRSVLSVPIFEIEDIDHSWARGPYPPWYSRCFCSLTWVYQLLWAPLSQKVWVWSFPSLLPRPVWIETSPYPFWTLGFFTAPDPPAGWDAPPWALCPPPLQLPKPLLPLPPTSVPLPQLFLPPGWGSRPPSVPLAGSSSLLCPVKSYLSLLPAPPWGLQGPWHKQIPPLSLSCAYTSTSDNNMNNAPLYECHDDSSVKIFIVVLFSDFTRFFLQRRPTVYATFPSLDCKHDVWASHHNGKAPQECPLLGPYHHILQMRRQRFGKTTGLESNQEESRAQASHFQTNASRGYLTPWYAPRIWLSPIFLSCPLSSDKKLVFWTQEPGAVCWYEKLIHEGLESPSKCFPSEPYDASPTPRFSLCLEKMGKGGTLRVWHPGPFLLHPELQETQWVAFLVCHAEIGRLLFVVPLSLAGFIVCPLPGLRLRGSGVPGRGNSRDALGREWWRSARTTDCWVTFQGSRQDRARLTGLQGLPIPFPRTPSPSNMPQTSPNGFHNRFWPKWVISFSQTGSYPCLPARSLLAPFAYGKYCCQFLIAQYMLGSRQFLLYPSLYWWFHMSYPQL